MKVAVIGGGPAGLSCAKALQDAGVSVDVYEKESAVGGMSKTIELWGQKVDLGPHRFFSMDEKVANFYLSCVKDEYIMVDRLTRIFYEKKFFLYPIKAFNALTTLGFAKACACVFSYVKAQFCKKGDEKTFEQWVSNRFGYKLYSIFFKSYSERLWGMSCTELDADFARQRIKGLNMFEVIRSAIFGEGGKKHKTLVDRFAYPKYGAGVPYCNIETELTKNGSNVYLNAGVKGIATKENKVCGVVLEEGGVKEYDYVVSTAPFSQMLCSIEGFPSEVYKVAKELKYRNTTLVYLQIAKENVFKDNWIYVHDANLQCGRITNFQNWSPFAKNGNSQSILALEYWSYDNDELWQMTDEDMILLAKTEICKTGLVNENDVREGFVYRMHQSYPVYNKGYQEKMRILQKAADGIENLCFIGRNGSFKYNNQDHSILMGLLASENILQEKKVHNLWSVNTDYDYQEGESKLAEN